MSADIRVRQTRVKCLGLHVMGHGQTVRSTTQASSYIRAPEGVAQYLGIEPKTRGSRSPEVSKHGANTGTTRQKSVFHILL